MGLFDTQIQSLRRQLSGLETSQRVALGLCVDGVAIRRHDTQGTPGAHDAGSFEVGKHAHGAGRNSVHDRSARTLVEACVFIGRTQLDATFDGLADLGQGQGEKGTQTFRDQNLPALRLRLGGANLQASTAY